MTPEDKNTLAFLVGVGALLFGYAAMWAVGWFNQRARRGPGLIKTGENFHHITQNDAEGL